MRSPVPMATTTTTNRINTCAAPGLSDLIKRLVKRCVWFVQQDISEAISQPIKAKIYKKYRI